MGESFGGKLRMAFRLGVAVSAPHHTGLHRNGPHRTTRGRRGVALAVTLSALLSVGLLGACSPQEPASAPQPNPTVAAPSQSAGSDAGSSDPTPTAKPSLPPDPKAPTKVQPVGRTGSAASSGKRVRATSASSFDAAVTWKDGIRLQVVGVEQGVTNGVGAGSSQGAPMTSFELSSTNSSTKPVELSAVLTAVYGGESKLVAQPVYAQAGASDFSGTVAPGKSATATYVYTIPTKQLGAVSLFVDIDGRHAIGSFTGSAR